MFDTLFTDCGLTSKSRLTSSDRANDRCPVTPGVMTGRMRRERSNVGNWARVRAPGVHVVRERVNGAEIQPIALDEAKGEKERVVDPEEL